jgi:hypothetical protein
MKAGGWSFQFSSAPVNTTRKTSYNKLKILTRPLQGEPVISPCSKHG